MGKSFGEKRKKDTYLMESPAKIEVDLIHVALVHFSDTAILG